MLCVHLFNRITQVKICLFRKSDFSFLFLFALFRYADYRQLAVNIFCDVGGEELFQVEALFGLQASLLQDGGESLHSKVAGFREMLYRICGVAPQAEPPKPPLKVSAQWRRMCAASVGKSTERNVSNN